LNLGGESGTEMIRMNIYSKRMALLEIVILELLIANSRD
jgi:hypothetical protein